MPPSFDLFSSFTPSFIIIHFLISTDLLARVLCSYHILFISNGSPLYNYCHSLPSGYSGVQRRLRTFAWALPSMALVNGEKFYRSFTLKTVALQLILRYTTEWKEQKLIRKRIPVGIDCLDIYCIICHLKTYSFCRTSGAIFSKPSRANQNSLQTLSFFSCLSLSLSLSLSLFVFCNNFFVLAVLTFSNSTLCNFFLNC